MDSIRKQATRFREQVAKQQQAVLKQLSGRYGGSDNIVTDEAELRQHQKLEKLYVSTRAGKHLQKDIIRGIERYNIIGFKQVEIGTKLSDDSRKYAESTCTSGSNLSKAALSYGEARSKLEEQYENLLKALQRQVAEPLKAMVMGEPLKDARTLAQRYNRIRQEAEAQVTEVSKRQAKLRESPGNDEFLMKLETAEEKLHDLKSGMEILGKEAAASLAAVEAQQQRMTLQRLISMVEAEHAYHQRAVQMLDQLENKMISERHKTEAPPMSTQDDIMPPSDDVNVAHASQVHNGSLGNNIYFIGEVIHAYKAVSDAELSLSIGDYVVVRKVMENGWAEGECKGKAGWFPYTYVERRDRVLAMKMAEVL